MLDDEAEEKRARWIFNLVVFFLVFAFAIDLSYMIGSLIPVGVGISLIAWRVWRTPGITNPDNFPHGTSPPPTRPELRACSRTTSVHHFRRDHLCHVRKIFTRDRFSLRGNTRDSNLLWARRRMLLIRSGISCFELSALGRDLIQYSHTSSLGSGSRSLVL